MKRLLIAVASILLSLPLWASVASEEAFPLDTADVVWTFTEVDFVEIYEADKLCSDTLTRELYKSASPWKRFVGRLAVFLRPVL